MVIPPQWGGTLSLVMQVESPLARFQQDMVAFCLTPIRAVRGAMDCVTMAQPVAAGIRLQDGVFYITLSDIPAEIERIVFACGMHDGQSRVRFSQCGSQMLYASLKSETGEAVTFAQDISHNGNSVLETLLLYRRDGGWKLKAIGQGFVQGITPLAEMVMAPLRDDYAPPVDAGEAAVIAKAEILPSRAAAVPAGRLPVLPGLIQGKAIWLDAEAAPVALRLDESQSEPPLVFNLRWDRAPIVQQKPRPTGMTGERGVLTAMFAAERFIGSGLDAIDLDLGCLYELKDGRRGGIQALGGKWGNYYESPFMQLAEDDRTGDRHDGEYLLVNPRGLMAIRRILVYALIYDGVPNWNSAAGQCLIGDGRGQTYGVSLVGQRYDHRICAIAMLEWDADGRIHMKAQHHSFENQATLDAHYNFNLRWVDGKKA